MKNDDDYTRRLEAHLMQKLDDEILRAEEADLLERYDLSIREQEQAEQEQQREADLLERYDLSIREQEQAEQQQEEEEQEQQQQQDENNAESVIFDLEQSPWLDSALSMAAFRQRIQARKAAELAQEFPDPEVLYADVCQEMVFVKATKLIPNGLGERWASRKDLEAYFVKKFRSHEGASLKSPLDWKGFRLRLRSANPTSWRLEVYGYRHTVDLLLRYLRRMFGKALKKQQLLNQQQEQQRQQEEAQQQHDQEGGEET